MGMLGHAAFVRPALTAPAEPHAGHALLSQTMSLPCGFPRWGDYRIYVQVKRGAAILTRVCDARVENRSLCRLFEVRAY